MTDQFLVKFALATLVAISFALQHGAHILARNISINNKRDNNVILMLGILVTQLCSIGIIVEIINYALKK